MSTESFVHVKLSPCSCTVGPITTARGMIDESIPTLGSNFVCSRKIRWNEMDIEEALCYLDLTPQPPSLDDFISISQSCRKTKNVAFARCLQARISECGLETHGGLGNHLVPMFVECGGVSDAQRIFYKLSYSNDYSWSSLVQGYVECKKFSQAFSLYEDMKTNRMNLGKCASVALLKACAKMKYVERGQELYGDIVKMGFDDYLFANNSLVDMYAKSGRLEEAQEFFDKLPARDIVSWNALIAGYVEHGLGEEAFSCFQQMQCEHLDPTPVTFMCGLKASSSIKAVKKGQEIHNEVVQEGHELNTFIGSALIDMYAKCGSLAEAQEVFDELPVKDVVTWTALISGYVEHELFEEAFHCLRQMHCDGVLPNNVTYLRALKACSSIGVIDKGLKLHAEIIMEGFENVPSAGSALVDMYAKCGSLKEAQDLFDELTDRSVVSWTALIGGYTEHGLLDEAMTCIDKMQMEGISPDPVMFLCIFKACSSIGAKDKGREVHMEVVQEGFECDLFIGNAIVDMYGKCGLLADAREVFEEMEMRDIISWNALISGYTQNGLSQEAQKCWEEMLLECVPRNVVSWNTIIQDKAEQGKYEEAFKLHAQMQEQGLIPDNVTLVSVLAASGDVVDIKVGKRIHAQTHSNGLVVTELIVLTALVDMYAKCGSMDDAQQVFDAMPSKDLVGWSALIMGYARQGEFERYFGLLERMMQEGIHLDEYSLESILTTCSHAGLVGEAQTFVKHMSKEVGFDLSNKHHNSMVDLLGRAGQLDEATAVLASMPYEPSFVTWNMVLGACKIWGNVELATDAFGEVLTANEDDSAPFVLMSNIVAHEKDKILTASN